MVRFVDITSSAEDLQSVDLTSSAEQSTDCNATSCTEETKERQMKLMKSTKNYGLVVVEDGGLDRCSAAGDGGDENCCCCTARNCLISWCIAYIAALIIYWLLNYSWENLTGFLVTGALIIFIGGLVPIFTLIGACTRNKCMLTVVFILNIIGFLFYLLQCVAIIYILVNYDTWVEKGENKKWTDLLKTGHKVGIYGVCAILALLAIPMVWLIVLVWKTNKNAK